MIAHVAAVTGVQMWCLSRDLWGWSSLTTVTPAMDSLALLNVSQGAGPRSLAVSEDRAGRPARCLTGRERRARAIGSPGALVVAGRRVHGRAVLRRPIGRA
ncbi:hypothetical protein Acsp04_50410 [Actinomadura sp. NBRC 104425]|nr:hypothetical protein Acsp04_50410 [Actinomadura sp. NBRC 104425]